ncbi:hypothetical protein KCV87_26650 [Actinosynnema pretiosum subsp. pretiosum]|uniref:Cobalt-precorrin-6y C5-methyltransferase n=1 Tax=Actinosynnema pretiosum subsp. pretiosum TaxID=103721 RepID=A0AA45R2P6_9PSEU|nr:Cobalt-precorrin-6y C5-methyltransferase [Actinosynnema pretiosum subsp. pretiosum]QUF02987.1 hypothetical protein KCV87_26650 [Actinosynnema pretiosum subsp. pretiosum]
MDVPALHRFLTDTGRTWSAVVVVDAAEHGLAHARNVCLARSSVLVANADPAALAKGLAGWRRTLVVPGPSGPSTADPAEVALRSWPEPLPVLCLAEQPLLPDASRWALPDDEFSHRGDGLVATAEVRALVLAKLGPRPGALVWDVAAGPGAVAVECARLGAAVVAVERDPVQCVRIIANASAHHVDVRVVESDVELAPRDLPRPDAVFVGGGGPGAVRACAGLGARRVVVATTRLDAVLPSHDALRDGGYAVSGTQLSAARLEDDHLRAVDPVTVLWAEHPA